jgi:hypothetical protein
VTSIFLKKKLSVVAVVHYVIALTTKGVAGNSNTRSLYSVFFTLFCVKEPFNPNPHSLAQRFLRTKLGFFPSFLIHFVHQKLVVPDL